MMRDIGYGNGDNKRLEEKLKLARARHAELQAKVAEKQQLKTELEPSSVDADVVCAKPGRRKKPKKGRKQPKRSSSRGRKSSRK